MCTDSVVVHLSLRRLGSITVHGAHSSELQPSSSVPLAADSP